MKILGIDPGFDRNGFAVLEKTPEHKTTLLFSECYETDRSLPFYDRLHLISSRLRQHIATYTPDMVSIEKLFFSKNKKTVMHISEMRGALILVARECSLPIAEYEPQTIKVSVTGNGRASKKDVIRMIHRLIRIDQKRGYDDEYDAIAIGITHLLASRRFPSHSP